MPWSIAWVNKPILSMACSSLPTLPLIPTDTHSQSPSCSLQQELLCLICSISIRICHWPGFEIEIWIAHLFAVHKIFEARNFNRCKKFSATWKQLKKWSPQCLECHPECHLVPPLISPHVTSNVTFCNLECHFDVTSYHLQFHIVSHWMTHCVTSNFISCHLECHLKCHLDTLCPLNVTSSGIFRISKRGPNFCWPLVLTQRVAKLSFPNFSYGEKKLFAKGDHGPMAPLNTPLVTPCSFEYHLLSSSSLPLNIEIFPSCHYWSLLSLLNCCHYSSTEYWNHYWTVVTIELLSLLNWCHYWTDVTIELLSLLYRLLKNFCLCLLQDAITTGKSTTTVSRGKTAEILVMFVNVRWSIFFFHSISPQIEVL